MKYIGIAWSFIFLSVFLFCYLPVSSYAGPAKLQIAPPEAKVLTTGPTTTDLSRLKLKRNIVTIRLEKGFFEFVEMMDFENEGSATIVSKGGAPTLRFVLPKSSNIRNPRARWGAAPAGLDPKFLTSMENELRTSEPIPPGRKFIVLLYRLEDEFGGIRVEKPILYDTPSFAVLPEKDRVQAQALELSAQPAVKFQNREYNRFVGVARAGTVVRIDMQAPDSMGGLGIFYVVGGIVVVLSLGIGFYIRRRRFTAYSAQVEREEILRAIASLDDRLAMGEISADEHARERAPRFGRLKELSD
ncbi:MAG: hypothetical protein OXL41_05545 [Nitrospinae bacterium]|nr:hypothetical protein [Nitrospinota bacterium]